MYYRLNFLLTQHKTITWTEIENMLPFEREIYTNLMIAELEKQREEAENAKRN